MGSPVPGGGGGGGGKPPLVCGPQCDIALNLLSSAKATVLAQCIRVASAKTYYIELFIFAFAMLLLALSLIAGAIAAFYSGMIPLGFISLAAAALFLAFFAASLSNAIGAQGQYQVQLAILSTDQSNFNNAADNVRMICPELCWPDLSPISC